MVNCKNCGAPLSLDEAVCSHCGTANPEAQEHLKKLAQLNKDYQKTKFEVVTEVKKNKKGYGVLTILIVVLLANLFLIPMHASSYSIADALIARRKPNAEVKEILSGYIESKDYERFVVTYDKYCNDYRSYQEYSRFYYQAYNYLRIKEYVTDYFFAKDLYMDALVNSCQEITDFKENYEHTLKYSSDDVYIEEIKEMNEDLDLFMRTYLKVNDADIEKMSTMSESELLVLISERLANEE